MDNMAEILGKKYNIVICYKQKKMDSFSYRCEEVYL